MKVKLNILGEPITANAFMGIRLRTSGAIALDIDGVIANFCLGFSKVVRELDSRAPLVVSYEDVQAWQWVPWYWPEGFSQELNDRAWEHIFDSETFWESLSPLFYDDMPLLAKVHREMPIVFMTRRDGINPWGQTVKWLHRYGIHEPLLVRLRSGEEKAPLCRKLGVTALIDDSPKNLELAWNWNVPVTVAMDWPYNRHVKTTYRVKTLREALEVACA